MPVISFSNKGGRSVDSSDWLRRKKQQVLASAYDPKKYKQVDNKSFGSDVISDLLWKSCEEECSSGGSNSLTIILSPSDLIAGGKDIVLEDVFYTIVNGTGETICLDFGIIGNFTLADNETFTAPIKPAPSKLGTTETLQFSQGACSGGGCTIV